MYDFLDNADFLKAKQKRNAVVITEFDRLRADRDHYNRNLLFRAYCIADGNISLMARGLGYSRATLVKYLIEAYSKDYKISLEQFMKNINKNE